MKAWRAVVPFSLLLTAIVVARHEPSASARVSPRPNVLIIVTDDQRGFSGDVMPRTSELFGSEGRSYRQAFATTPMCCQSRATIFTGRYAHNHRVRHIDPEHLKQSTTIQRYLSDAGYRTGIFGKYLNAWNLEKDPPHFDDWAIFPQSNESTYTGGQWNVQGDLEEVSEYSTDYIRNKTAEFLDDAEGNDDQPWYLYLATPAAHTPYIAEPKYASLDVGDWAGNPATFESNLRDKPRYVREGVKACDYACGVETRAKQLRTLASVDEMIGVVFDRLEDLGEDEETLAVIISDNGLMWGEHGLSGKGMPYTPAARVPMMIRWPGKIAPGKDGRLVANIDVAPSVLDATGIPQSVAEPMDGRSLFAEGERSKILLEHWRRESVPAWASIRHSRWQYVENYSPEGTFREYYDLRKDPAQLHNLLHDGKRWTGPSQRRLARLRDRLDEHRDCIGGDCP